MKNSHQSAGGQDGIEELIGDDAERIDPETGEILTEADIGSFQDGDDTSRDMFEPREGRSTDGSIWLPKITMATIRVFAAKCHELHEGQGGKMKAAIFTGLASGTKIMENAEKTEAFVALIGEFSAIRFDLSGEPDAIFKSDTIFFPICHSDALARLERQGSMPFSLEFSSQPAANKATYSWSYRNLAKIDRNNLSPVDRLIAYSVAASRALADKPAAGLLADLRREPLKLAASR